MDWLSVLLAALGFSSERQTRTADKRQEAYAIVADANGEISRGVDLINLSEARLLRRLEVLAPGDIIARAPITAAMSKLRQDAQVASETLVECRTLIEGASGRKLDKALAKLVELQATSKRIVPWIEGAVRQVDDIIDNARNH